MSIGTLVAGVDSSTQATKVVIVDPDDGRIVAQGHARHTVSGTGGAREIGPEGVVVGPRGTRSPRLDAPAKSGRSPSAASSMGWSPSTATERRSVPASLWNDTRAAEDAERLTERLGAPSLGAR